MTVNKFIYLRFHFIPVTSEGTGLGIYMIPSKSFILDYLRWKDKFFARNYVCWTTMKIFIFTSNSENFGFMYFRILVVPVWCDRTRHLLDFFISLYTFFATNYICWATIKYLFLPSTINTAILVFQVRCRTRQHLKRVTKVFMWFLQEFFMITYLRSECDFFARNYLYVGMYLARERNSELFDVVWCCTGYRSSFHEDLDPVLDWNPVQYLLHIRGNMREFGQVSSSWSGTLEDDWSCICLLPTKT